MIDLSCQRIWANDVKNLQKAIVKGKKSRSTRNETKAFAFNTLLSSFAQAKKMITPGKYPHGSAESNQGKSQGKEASGTECSEKIDCTNCELRTRSNEVTEYQRNSPESGIKRGGNWPKFNARGKTGATVWEETVQKDIDSVSRC